MFEFYMAELLRHRWMRLRLYRFRAIEAALVKHDNNMKDYSLVVD